MRAELSAEEHIQNGFRLAWIENDRTAALREFAAALRIEPHNSRAHLQIGQIHFYESDLIKALREFEEVNRLAPHWGEGHLFRANTLQDLERFEEAESAYYRTIDLMPDDPRPHISLGTCLVKLGRLSEAIAAFRKGIALKLAYGEIASRMMLADALLENGQKEEALEQWRTVANMEAVWDYEQDDPGKARQMLTKYGDQR